MLYRLLMVLIPISFSGVAVAHHSVAASFDTTEIIEAEGEVTSLSWRNPHVRFQMSVEDGSGSAEIWDIEMTSLTNLRLSGLTEQLISVGDTVRVAGAPGRRSATAIYAGNLLLASGEEVLLTARAEPRWSDDVLGREERVEEGDTSAPELGIFRVWMNGPGQMLLFPEDVNLNFDFSVYPLTESARTAQAAFDPVTDSPILNCVSKGMPTIMEQPYPMQFVQQGEDIVIRLEEYDTLRMIHMAADATDEGQPFGKLGYSIGHWENDRALAIRTTRSDWGYLDVVGVPLSEDALMDELFTVSEDGSRLDYSLTIADPSTFTEPLTVTKFWIWRPEVTVEPFQCRI